MPMMIKVDHWFVPGHPGGADGSFCRGLANSILERVGSNDATEPNLETKSGAAMLGPPKRILATPVQSLVRFPV